MTQSQRRQVSGVRKTVKRSGKPSVSRKPQAASQPGAFVDARRLRSEDPLQKTLRETSGRIGIATRPKVVDFTARRKERKRMNVRTILIRVGIAVVSLAVIIGLVWFLFFSPVFRLRADKITVRGANAWVSNEQILNIADQQVGKSLIVVSDAKVESALENIPGVSHADSQKKFPNGLTVSVTAQRPAAMLRVKGGNDLTAVDSRGRVLNSVAKGASVAGIPVIEVNNVNKALKNKGVLAALTILNDLPESMRKDVASVSANTQDSITTRLSSGITVVWGDAADAKLKIAIVDKIIHDPAVIGDKTQVDVSAPSRPIMK